MVLTPVSSHELRPLVAKILERASSIPGWNFYDARLPEGIASMYTNISWFSSFDIDDLLVKASISGKQLADLRYYSPKIENVEHEMAFNAQFVATKKLLGEHCFDRWVGEIEISPVVAGQDAPLHAIRLDRLKDTVETASDSIRDRLPPTMHHEWAEGAE